MHPVVFASHSETTMLRESGSQSKETAAGVAPVNEGSTSEGLPLGHGISQNRVAGTCVSWSYQPHPHTRSFVPSGENFMTLSTNVVVSNGGSI
jgi:hypothetical protein